MYLFAWIEKRLAEGEPLYVVHMEVGQKNIDPVRWEVSIKIDPQDSGSCIEDELPGCATDRDTWGISPISLPGFGGYGIRTPCTVQLYLHNLCSSSQKMAMAPENFFDLPTMGMAVTEILVEFPFRLLIQNVRCAGIWVLMVCTKGSPSGGMGVPSSSWGLKEVPQSPTGIGPVSSNFCPRISSAGGL
jgi:hypothetical protein